MELFHLLLTLSMLVLHLSSLGETNEGEGRDSTGIQTWGEEPVGRENLDLTPSSKSMIPSPKTVFSRTGTLKNWTVNFGNITGRVRLQVWRLRSADEENYKFYYELIGQTDYQSAADMGNGTHTFAIWPRTKIRVASNDTIGIQWEDANPISYDLRGMSFCSTVERASRVKSADTDSTIFVEGNEYRYVPHGNRECRRYSLQVHMEIRDCKKLVANEGSQVEQIFKQRMDADYCWLLAPSDAGHMLQLEVLQERSIGAPLVNNCSFVSMEIRIGLPAITSSLDHMTCDFEYHQVPFEAENLGIYLRLVTSSSSDYPESLAILMSYKSKPINLTCEGVSLYDDTRIEIQSPGFPWSYEKNQDVCWIISTSEDMRLKMDVIESALEPSYGEDSSGCVDFVEIFDGPEDKFPLVNKWCGNTLPDSMVSSQSTVLVRFFSGPYQEFRGFKMTLGAIKIETDLDGPCTQLMVTPIKQFLYSPGYPHSYRNDEDLCWMLKAADGFRIMLKVYDSIIEGDTQDCEYDVAVIRDGIEANTTLMYPLLRRWCGEVFPKAPVITSGNKALIQLQTDSSVGGFGFYLSYIQVRTDACTVYGVYPYAVELTAKQVLRTSPTTTCILLETDLPGNRVRLELIQDFKIDDCSENYIAVYNASDPEDRVARRWCNSPDSPVVGNLGNSLKLVIKTSAALEDITFRISYMAIDSACEHISIDKEEGVGYLNSPISDSWEEEEDLLSDIPMDSPVKYLPNLDRCWVVDSTVKPAFLLIRLTFLDLEEATNGKCVNDFLEIRDGEDENAPLLAKECGHLTVKNYFSTGRFAFVRFVTNSKKEYRGFQIRFIVNDTRGDVECPVIQISKNYTEITSPGYPEPYESLSNICWILNATAPLRLQLTFLDYTVEARCLDYLEIYDGDSDSGVPVNVVCWPDTPEIVESTGPSLFLRFRSDYSVEGRGFKIKVKAISRSAIAGTCIHKTVSAVTRELTLATYPKPYETTQEICWVLAAPNHDQRIVLNAVISDILKSSSCQKDYIEALDGPYLTSEPIHRWCGDELPPPMTTSGRSVLVHFRAGSDNANNTGFIIHYTLVSEISETNSEKPPVRPGIRNSYFQLILAGIIGLILIILVIALLAACVIIRIKRQNLGNNNNPQIRMNQSNINMPGPVLNAASDLGTDTDHMDIKGLRLNPDGSAVYNTAFENPGYATLPGTNRL